MSLAKDLTDDKPIIAIVGMFKNAGKTVTMNHLVETLEGPIGITSIGRDGERQDVVTKTDKPMIFVPRGTYIATAEMLFHLSEAKMEVIEVTPHHTAMGKVIIGRTLEEGFVQVGGPATNSGVHHVSKQMLKLGAQKVLVDGALDRTSSASPAISDGCILATGAVLSRDMQKTVAETVHRVKLFDLPYHGSSVVDDLWQIAREKSAVVLCDDEGRHEVLSIKTALNAGRYIAEMIDEKTQYVIIPGALVKRTLSEIIETTPHYKHVTFVVGDATRIFIERLDWLHFLRHGVQVVVQMPVTLMALTANPYAPSGYYYDSQLFVQALKKEISHIPVMDVMDSL